MDKCCNLHFDRQTNKSRPVTVNRTNKCTPANTNSMQTDKQNSFKFKAVEKVRLQPASQKTNKQANK